MRPAGGRAEALLRPHTLLLVLPLALALSAYPAAAQNETTNVTAANATATPTQTVTIVFPNASIQPFPSVFLRAYYIGPDQLKVDVNCFAIVSSCPNVTVSVGWGGAVRYRDTVSWQCGITVCAWSRTYTVAAQTAFVVYEVEADGVAYGQNVTVSYTPLLPGIAGYFFSMLPFAIIAGLMARGNPTLAGLGGIAAGVILYAMSLMGFVPNIPYAYLMAIVMGALLLWEARR